MTWNSATFALDYASRKVGRVSIRLVSCDGVAVIPSRVPATVVGARIRSYPVPGLRIELAVYPKGVEIFKVLESGKAPRSLMWEVTEPVDNPIKVDLMSTRGKDNLLRLVDRKAEFNIQRPIEMLHEMGRVKTDGVTRTYTVTETFTGRTRFVDSTTMARAWVADVAYPVEIDVTVNESVGTTADDGYGREYSYWRTNKVVSKRLTGGGKYSGWRFTTVDVPNAATITSATLTVNVTSKNATGTGTIKGQATDSAGSWADFSANSPGTMSGTTATTSYSVPASTGSQAIDVTTIVQEIVNRAGWAANNDIRIGFTDVSTFGAVNQYVYFEDYAAAGTAQATLDIVYTAGGAAGQPTMRRFGGVPGMGQGQSFGRSW